MVLVSLALRWGTDITNLPEVRDEALMQIPITNILEQGWTRTTLLDYQELKGPSFYWLYALGGEVLGGEMNDLRLISIICFILSAIPFLLILQFCGVRGPMLLAGAALYALTPYNAFVAQLLMSEPSFILFATWLMWAFVWGFGDDPSREKRLWGPIVFAILLSVLLHHRPHAVAFAGAACLVAFERDGFRSWPWWLACIVAGLSRLPLWWYWGGLVTSDYQDLFTFGLRLDCQPYLIAAMLPATWVFLWLLATARSNRLIRAGALAGGLVGLVVAIAAMPDIYGRVEYQLPGEAEPRSQAEYAGVISTLLKSLFSPGAAQQGGLLLLATLGGASFGAMGGAVWTRPASSAAGIVCRLAFWTLAVGVPLYIVTSGPVYDRYLSIWFILLPAAWLLLLPRSAVLVQAALMLAMLVYLAREWLH